MNILWFPPVRKDPTHDLLPSLHLRTCIEKLRLDAQLLIMLVLADLSGNAQLKPIVKQSLMLRIYQAWCEGLV